MLDAVERSTNTVNTVFLYSLFGSWVILSGFCRSERIHPQDRDAEPCPTVTSTAALLGHLRRGTRAAGQAAPGAPCCRPVVLSSSGTGVSAWACARLGRVL